MGKFIIEKDGNIWKLTICESTEINIELFKKMYKIFSNSKKAIIIKLEGNIYIGKAALDFMNRIENRKNNSNIAIIADSFSENLLANFYNKFYKPTFPIKIFRKENEALLWLKTKTMENDFKFLFN